MKKESKQNKKEGASDMNHNKTQKGKSAMVAADKSDSATRKVNPHSRTGLSKNLADTGTNVSYENEE